MNDRAQAIPRLARLKGWLRSALVPLFALSIVVALKPAAGAERLSPSFDSDPGGGNPPQTGDNEADGNGGTGGGSGSSVFQDVSCDTIYLLWWESVESLARGMWYSQPGWSGCIAVTAKGIDESGSYTVKVPYLTTSYESGARNGRKDVVAVHGATFDGDGWHSMCRFLLRKYGKQLYRCFAPSLTGMGGSSYPGAHNEWPNGTELEDMHEIEFAGALDAALTGIKAKEGLSTGQWILAGHSNGGMTIQMLQNRLADQGTHLRAKYGIDKVVMMAPVLPHEVCWTYVDDVENHTDDPGYPVTDACDDDETIDMWSSLLDTINGSLEVDWDAGTFADLQPNTDDSQWIETWWSERGENDDIVSSYDASRNGRLPTASEAYDVDNWMGLQTFNEMVGLWPWSRPQIDSDIWGGTNSTCYDRSSSGTPCTRFVSIVFDQDSYIYTPDVQNLHRYLTTSWPTCVSADSAYHDCVIVKGTHGAAFSLYATAWDKYVNQNYRLRTQMDPVWDVLVAS